MNAQRLLGTLLGGGLSGARRGRSGGLMMRGGLGGGFGGTLGRAATSRGGLALLGGLAAAAYEHFNQSRNRRPGHAPSSGPPSVPPPPPGMTAGRPATEPPPPPPAAASGMSDEDLALLLVRAMVAAAKADGEIDADERGRILKQLEEAGADADDRAFVEREFATPLDVDALAAEARDPTVAAELYAASAMAIDADTPAEKLYLQLLATKLGLPNDLVASIDARIEDSAP
ncbi:tellurite resistance TerB family protein [Inquilinus sp. CAU 1745]|uniref:tellurite resistance TerB family protein n=1 Tax=Inquilinus sp. CAU 1745 TaxID=3140369 RepID=UPI00325B1877